MRRLRFRTLMSAGAIALTLSASLAGPADARRGGSFGSRGGRTYYAPRSTYTAPSYTAPVSRSMTPNTGGFGGARYGQSSFGAPRYGVPGAQPGRRSWVGPLLGGLAAGGLLGMMMGHGFGGGYSGGWGGGGAGLLGGLFQLALIGFVIWFALRLFRRRRPDFAPAGAAFGNGGASAYAAPTGSFLGGGPEPGQWQGQGGPAYGATPGPAGDPNRPDEIGLGQGDYDSFERLLNQVQGAFGREDYAALRECCTPEIVSYLSEELSQNATAGKRNEVKDVRLLQGDLSEAWREGDHDFATVAMRYSSVDVMRDRATGRVLEGDETRPTETTELWTFARDRGGVWKLSAIQETGR